MLKPAGTAPGEVVGEVSVTRQSLTANVNVQNYGSQSVGRWGVLASAQASDLIGLGDRLTLGVFNTVQVHEQTVLQAGYDIRVGGEGLILAGRAVYAWTRPDIGGSHPLTSHTLVGTIEASYPFRRSQAADVRGVLGVDLVNQDLSFSGTPLTRDRLRVIYARLDFGAVDPASIAGSGGRSVVAPRWRFGGSLEARRGLGVLGSNQDCGPSPFTLCQALPTPSRLDADATGTLVRFNGQGEFRPGHGIGLALSPRLQYGFDPLLSYEQYSGGAYTIGRGYDPGAIVGNSGAGATLEARLGQLAPRSRRAFAFQPYAFVDAAWAWTRDATTGMADPDRLLSAGGGLRVAWGDRARADLLFAKPLHRTGAQIERGGARVLLSITARLVPWSLS